MGSIVSWRAVVGLLVVSLSVLSRVLFLVHDGRELGRDVLGT